MRKLVALLGLLTCWPMLASVMRVMPAVDGRTAAADFQSEWRARAVPSVRTADTPTYFPEESTFQRFTGPDLDLGPASALDPFAAPGTQPLTSSNYILERPPLPLSGETSSPGKMALFVILLVGAIIRFLSSATLRNFLREVYSPFAPY